MSGDFTFYWHDYETFGKSPRRDRPSQFAGVRTDADLNEIGEPLMQYCQPPRDYLPEPEACLLTGILPQTCQEQGIPEHAFADAIERELAEHSTVGVGYNTIRFDDEVTRHMFWRNLIDPYAREWQNGCGRWDLLDVVRCTWALRPDGIQWPKHDDGRPSFKLEHLTVANGLTHEAAHDALSDVRATIALARLIKQAQPKLWDFCLKLRKKDAVLNEMGVGRPFIHISGMYGVERGCMALVWPLAPHPSNKNEMIVWDLAFDPTELFDLNAQAIRERMFSKTEDLPEGATFLPVLPGSVAEDVHQAAAIGADDALGTGRLERHPHQERPPLDPAIVTRGQGIDLLGSQIAVGRGEVEVEFHGCEGCRGFDGLRHGVFSQGLWGSMLIAQHGRNGCTARPTPALAMRIPARQPRGSRFGVP